MTFNWRLKLKVFTVVADIVKDFARVRVGLFDLGQVELGRVWWNGRALLLNLLSAITTAYRSADTRVFIVLLCDGKVMFALSFTIRIFTTSFLTFLLTVV